MQRQSHQSVEVVERVALLTASVLYDDSGESEPPSR